MNLIIKNNTMIVLNYIIILLYNIICMLLITLVIASLTLTERKILSLIQRRVGPNFVGYRGRLQYLADALKLFVKGIIIPDEVNKFWFITIPSIVAAICYTFWINSVWGPSISIFELEYNLVYGSLLSVIFSYCIILTGYFSKNKYAIMASVRCMLLVLNLEVFLGLMVLNLVIIVETFNFNAFSVYQEVVWFSFTFFFVLALIIITFLLETNRAPFDLAEAESELIAGYTVEYGGFFFALFYLGEYFHLFFFSMVISIMFLGSWEFTRIYLIFTNIYSLI